MSTTIQFIMAGIALVGYALGELRRWAATPVGSDVLSALSDVISQKQKADAHTKVAALATHGAAILKDLAVVKNVEPPIDPELQKALDQAKQAYLARQKAGG